MKKSRCDESVFGSAFNEKSLTDLLVLTFLDLQSFLDILPHFFRGSKVIGPTVKKELVNDFLKSETHGDFPPLTCFARPSLQLP